MCDTCHIKILFLLQCNPQLCKKKVCAWSAPMAIVRMKNRIFSLHFSINTKRLSNISVEKQTDFSVVGHFNLENNKNDYNQLSLKSSTLLAK